jgi:drug/metabolite transporter (DMT)-like permease
VHTGLAVGAALGSAFCFALSSVLQQRGAARCPDDTGARLVLHLLRRPVWLGGLLCAVATVILQFVALASGELALVQPLLLLGLLFALPISVLLEKCKPSPREWGWALVLVAGLTTFLAAARPAEGPPLADDSWMFELGVGAAVLIGGLILLGWKPAKRHRAALLGLATGIGYGVSAALMKYCYGLASDHPSRLLTSWPGYAFLVIGGATIMLNQLAYRSGPLAGALPPLAIADPLVATVFGVAAFSETLHTGIGAIILETLGVVVVVIAIARLASYAAGRGALEPHSAEEHATAGVREAALAR